jgi:hypothetical protein
MNRWLVNANIHMLERVRGIERPHNGTAPSRTASSGGFEALTPWLQSEGRAGGRSAAGRSPQAHDLRSARRQE